MDSRSNQISANFRKKLLKCSLYDHREEEIAMHAKS